MARFLLTIAAMLSLGQTLPGMRSEVTALVLQKHEMQDVERLTRDEQRQQTTQNSENLQLGAHDWRATCLTFSENQTMQAMNRKEHIAVLSRSLSEDVSDGYHGTLPSLANPCKNGKRETGRKEVITRRIFSNVVKRRKGMRGVVRVLRFPLHGADISSKRTSMKLLVYNTCRKGAHETVLVMRLQYKRRKQMNRCGGNTLVAHVSGKRTATRWMALNITTQIKTLWQNFKPACKKLPTTGLSLLIKVRKCISHEMQKTADGEKLEPHLELVTVDEPAVVMCNAPLECTPGEKRCCIERSIMSLDEFGELASPIIVPRIIPVGKCRGLCSINPGQQAATKPCCVPTKTLPLSMIEVRPKADIYVQTNWLDAIVDQCGCV